MITKVFISFSKIYPDRPDAMRFICSRNFDLDILSARIKDRTQVLGLYCLRIATKPQKESIMGKEDVTAGKIKQIKGKANDIAGALTGNIGQQIKGKTQMAVGKVQEAVGKATANKATDRK